MTEELDLGVFPAGSLPALAARFALVAHNKVGQVRKYTGQPYFVHPWAVAMQVMKVEHDAEMLAAALLHDTVEDTHVEIGEIAWRFGFQVARLVDELTDVSKPEDGNRSVRKEIDRQHTAKASARAKTIKLADLIDNTKSILEHDLVFARIYLNEKARLLEVLGEGDAYLYGCAKTHLSNGLLIVEQHFKSSNRSPVL